MKVLDALQTLSLRNFRAHADTGPLEFSRLNIFVGANNSGKSSILSGVEVFLRSASGGGFDPLALSSVQHFSSFDAAVRKAWSSKAKRAETIQLEYSALAGGKNRPVVL